MMRDSSFNKICSIKNKWIGGTHTYKIVDNGRRKVRSGKDWIEFTHDLSDGAGYGYSYSKKISLARGKPEMVLAHTLKNTGTKPIETTVFNHGFFQIDGQA